MDYMLIPKADAETLHCLLQGIDALGAGAFSAADIPRADGLRISAALTSPATTADLLIALGAAANSEADGADMATADGYATLPCDGDCGRGGAIRHDRDACNAAYKTANRDGATRRVWDSRNEITDRMARTLDPPPRYDAVYRAAVERMDADGGLLVGGGRYQREPLRADKTAFADDMRRAESERGADC